MKKVLILGSQGFIGSYVCRELLDEGYEVFGLDDFSKYGPVVRPHDKAPNFRFIQYDVKHLDAISFMSDTNSRDISKFIEECDYVIALAAKIGGISYFHKYAYDLFSENEGIMKATFDTFIRRHQKKPLERIVVLSSSMVYESAMSYPSFEDDVNMIHAPFSSYGRQKLVCEWWAKAAWEQYKLPYTIVRPFNCVGVGEERALGEHEITSGNIKLMLSHVLPDLINKVLQGQDPLHILGSGEQIRCYTNGKDIARGIRLAMESDKAINEDFNISTPEPTTVLELAKKVHREVTGKKLTRWVNDEPFEYDVQKRIPDVSKAKNLLGFEAKISIDESIKEVTDYMRGSHNV